MRSDPKKAMEAFDRLPPEIRRALREALFTHSSLEAEDLLTKYRAPISTVVEIIKENDAEIAARSAARKRDQQDE